VTAASVTHLGKSCQFLGRPRTLKKKNVWLEREKEKKIIINSEIS